LKVHVHLDGFASNPASVFAAVGIETRMVQSPNIASHLVNNH